MFKRIITAIIIAVLVPGCVTTEYNAPISELSDGTQITISDAVTYGVQLAHPELTDGEAKKVAKEFYEKHRESILAHVDKVVDSDAIEQAQAVALVALYIRSLMYSTGGNPVE